MYNVFTMKPVLGKRVKDLPMRLYNTRYTDRQTETVLGLQTLQEWESLKLTAICMLFTIYDDIHTDKQTNTKTYNIQQRICRCRLKRS